MSWEEIQNMALMSTAVRCGETDDPQERRREYNQNINYQEGGYTMYWCQVNNVQNCENVLLGMKDWKKNLQKTSTAQNKPGFVYIIINNY